MIRFLLASFLLFFAGAASAQETAPDVLVKTVTQEVIGIVKQDKEIQSGNTKKTIALVEEKVLPHFNFARMTALAMGQNWRRATPEQQKQLTDQFRTLLVRTYSSAITQYRNQTIDFKPMRMQAGDTEVLVRSEVKQPGAEAIGIDYAMEKTPAGWKVFDVSVAGVSLVTTYRETFATEVRNAGVDGLIKTLSDKNRQLETKNS